MVPPRDERDVQSAEACPGCSKGYEGSDSSGLRGPGIWLPRLG